MKNLLLGSLFLALDIIFSILIGCSLARQGHPILLCWLVIHMLWVIKIAHATLRAMYDAGNLRQFQDAVCGIDHEESGDSNHSPIPYLDHQLKHFHLWS